MRQLSQKILKELALESYPPGKLLPSETELCEKFNASETEIRQALGDLVYEGLVERNPFNRSEVRVPRHQLWGTITGNHSFTREARRRNMEPGVEILTFETVPAWPAVRQRLQLEPEDLVLVMERLRLADGQPVALEYSYMPAKFYPGATREMFEEGGEGQSSFKVMEEKFGLKSARAVDEVTVAAIEKREAKLLQMDEGVPVLLRFRVTLSGKGVPIKGSRAIYKFKAGYELDI